MTEHDKDKLPIKLHLYDLDITVYIIRKDEPLYRNAATLISDTISRYAQRYAGQKSSKEIFYMAAVDMALRLEQEKNRNNTEPYTDIIDQLTLEVEDALGDNI